MLNLKQHIAKIDTQFELVEFYNEEKSIFPHLNIHLTGILCNYKGEMVSGSAGSISEDSFNRAYWELLERVSVLEAMKNKRAFKIFDEKQNLIGETTRPFPSPIKGKNFQLARSNGVALHENFYKAAQSAKSELLEREDVLRSWYNQIPLKKGHFLSQHLEEFFDLKLFHLSTTTSSNFTVCLWAKDKKGLKPPFYSFGGGKSIEGAISSAENELIQRIGFLWDEDFCEKVEKIIPNAEFHLDYFAGLEGQRLIETWFNNSSPKEIIPSKNISNIKYIDITPSFLFNKFSVVKAISDTTLPLYFGQKETINNIKIPKELQIQPIA